ncbi:MAG: LysR family transcriptional regulator [Myxococcales bacterium]|nr:LysR family transcriptional regulator [Myxococcales bacterium]
MTLSQLLCFVETSRTGSLTSAAARLGLPKSSVSKHIRRLEELLGVQLFERSSRKVRSTRAGETLLPRIESILADLDTLVAEASEQRADPKGLVRIAATPELGALVALHLYPALSSRHPAIQVAMSSTYGFEDLQDPSFDLALRVGRVVDDRLVARPLGFFHRVLVARPGYAARHRLTTPTDLARVPCLFFSGQRASATWSFVRDGRPDAVEQVELSGTFAVHGFVALGAAGRGGPRRRERPDFVAAPAIAAGRLERVLPRHRSPPTPVHLVFRVGADRVHRVRVVLDLVLEVVTRLLMDRRGGKR